MNVFVTYSAIWTVDYQFSLLVACNALPRLNGLLLRVAHRGCPLIAGILHSPTILVRTTGWFFLPWRKSFSKTIEISCNANRGGNSVGHLGVETRYAGFRTHARSMYGTFPFGHLAAIERPNSFSG